MATEYPREFTPAATRTVAAAVVAQFLGATMAIGVFSLLTVPMAESFGWSRTVAGSMAGASAAAAAFGMPLWGVLVDRYGTRPMLLAGTTLAVLAFLLLSIQTGNLAQSYLSFALAGFAASVSVANIKALSQQFVARRGLVLGIMGVTIGMSFGVTPLMAKPMLDAQGWRAVYAMLGVLTLIISLPLLLVWFRPAPLSSKPWLTEGGKTPPAFATLGYWLIVLFAGCSSFVFIALQAHFVPFLKEQALTEGQAVMILSLATAGALVCQLGTGWLLDRWNSPRAALPFIGAQLLGTLLLIGAAFGMLPKVATTMVGVVLLNSGAGGELSMLPYLIGRTFGTARIARLYGVAALAAQLMGAVSAVLFGVVHDRTGHYAAALPLFIVLQLVSVLIIVSRPAFPPRAPDFSPSKG